MKEPKSLNVKNGYDQSLSVSHLSDIKKCHILASSYGEYSSASLGKAEVRRLVNWLNRWLEFKDSVSHRKDAEVKE